MLTQSLVQYVTQPVVRSVVNSLRGSTVLYFTNEDQTASLVLNFTRNFYGLQSADAATANTINPRPNMLLDFANDLYFMEGT